MEFELLLDWINTFNSPRCILVNSIQDLENYLVFSDILKCILSEMNLYTNYSEIFKKIESESNLDIRKSFILEIISYFYSQEEINFHFKNTSNTKLYLFKFIQILKYLDESRTTMKIKPLIIGNQVNKEGYRKNNINKSNQYIFTPQTNDFELKKFETKRNEHKDENNLKQGIEELYQKYSVNHRSQLALSRGIPKIHEIQIFTKKIPILNFKKSTNPVIYSDFTSFLKYKPKINIHEKEFNEANTQDPKGISPEKKQLINNEFGDIELKENFNKFPELVDWLIELRVINKNEGKFPPDQLLCLFSSGIRFGELINNLEGKSRPIKGIQLSDKKTADIMNVNKILAFLRNKSEKINYRHLYDNEMIVKGDLKTIYELLTDIYVYYKKSRIISKAISKSFEILPKEDQLVKNLNMPNTSEKIKENKLQSIESRKDSMLSKGNPNENGVSKKLVKIPQTYFENKQTQNENSFFITFDKESIPQMREKLGSPKSLNKPNKSTLIYSNNLDSASRNQSNSSNGFPSIDFLKYNTHRSYKSQFSNQNHSISNSFIKRCNLNKIENDKIQTKENSIILNNWLKFFNFKNFKEIDFSQQKVNFLQDGIILFKIIQTLENFEVPGIDLNPRTVNMKNIQKIFDHLKKNKKISFDILDYPEDVYSGKTESVMKLLFQLKRAYKKEYDFKFNSEMRKRYRIKQILT